MDEYIKKDDAIRAALKGASLHYHDQFGAVDIAAAIDELPTADVAPKSEVEKIFAEIELFLNKAIDGWRKERTVAYNDRQIEMIDFRNGAFKYCLHEIAELKKKYVPDINVGHKTEVQK